MARDELSINSKLVPGMTSERGRRGGWLFGREEEEEKKKKIGHPLSSS